MNNSGDYISVQPGRLKKVALSALSVAAILAGVMMVIYGALPRSYGWFAYAPLSDNSVDFGYPDPFTLVVPWTIAGIALIIGGLLVLALVSGHRWTQWAKVKFVIPGLALLSVLAGALIAIYSAMPREFVTASYDYVAIGSQVQDPMTDVVAWGAIGLMLTVAGLLAFAFLVGRHVGRRR
ncbi:hypothetical protein AL755_10460 [Arthrobacter sp. ERGS1:01]|uniref:hypothetical protein n=1 Tax=Arthrobacter sp. ERGS1:01 TaxID=1704044 RepID=UPI0006B4645D|nr:hypothetical protein [Arthrobacter sp. ERGS1:01]ALE05793.1 hypothetical protein AL755_10460 [Arthrobacter sp. ERGS1:01]